MDVKQAAVQQVLEEKTLEDVPLGGRDIQGIGVSTAGVQQSAPTSAVLAACSKTI